MRLLLLLGLGLLSQAQAAYAPLGHARPERFDQRGGTWRSLPVSLDFDPAAEKARLRLPKISLEQPLYARLDLKKLPNYAQWLSSRKEQGGTLWTALQAVLDEVGEGPVVAMTHSALKLPGSNTLLLGLRKGSRFELYATVHGLLSSCGQELCFEPAAADFAKSSTALAWGLFKPWALAQIKGRPRS